MIVLPFPDRNLSPNGRLHWRKVADAKRKARSDAYALATLALSLRDKRAIAAREGKIAIFVRFFPPDNRRRDDDNMVAGFKAYRDGLADALGIDDNRFSPTYQFMDPDKPGRVEVVICSSDG